MGRKVAKDLCPQCGNLKNVFKEMCSKCLGLKKQKENRIKRESLGLCLMCGGICPHKDEELLLCIPLK